jgi:thymidylate kinase
MEHLIVITGSMGTGKTTALGEASDLLTERGIHHAAVDLDALSVAYLPDREGDGVMVANLAAVCANYAAARVNRLVLAAAIESRADLRRIVTAAGAMAAIVCRLRAAPEVMEQRVAARERGIYADRYVARARVLDRLLDQAALEDFSIDTTDSPITAVATEILGRAGWLVDIAGGPS